MSRVSGLAELTRLKILRGEIAPGELLNQATLAERLRTSRSTLREALRLLEGRGLLVANESGGMRVVEVDAGGLDETLRVRAALEALSAAEAAGRARRGGLGAEGLRRVSALVDAGEVAAEDPRPAAAVLADRTLHLAVAALSDNRVCHAALDHLWDRIVIANLRCAAWPPRSAQAGEHRLLVAAVAGGDEDGASAIARRHVLATAGRG